MLAAVWWALLLRWISGSSGATTVPIMMMGPHMQATIHAAERPGDRERASAVLAAAHQVVAQYEDVHVAERAGYKEFAPDSPGMERHFVNPQLSREEGKRLELPHPGALLYDRLPNGGLQIHGVMYTALGNVDAAQLDVRLPRSIAVWHRHVDFCVAAHSAADDHRFGFDGTIHTEDVCKAARGTWVPLAFGWMTHVFPNAPAGPQQWGGNEMNMGQTGS